MKAKTITEAEMAPLRISSLPTRPTAPIEYGGKGYTSSEMKEAFDLLPNLIAQRYNSLLEDILSGDFAKEINTGADSVKTLGDFFTYLANGTLADLIMIEGKSLSSVIAELRAKIK